MPRKEPIKFNEFIALVPEEQAVRVVFDGLSVIGTQEGISSIANSDINLRDVIKVSAFAEYLEVWVRDETA